ncbi:universal stress protein [Halorubrum sp. Atlit-8R]|uniref:universal stress protein n=1 Tax=unclassified Halorubrum TaxID=2642239 RepID=UPI000EF247E7|nr:MULTISPECIES: universal stress protein [unclassified Halorubrum]RLM71003.1 universal stress protein [Halorubrum sp. Atlit-9R]RLM71871.1 universal stress protein [Halorubrum sp. Atlit-9R]RLM82844.1 universal stress protein [Halorubrum sp. Atlit-8R]TKX85619.1 universal stress protein [Halorubrum sp. SS5]
MYDRILYPTDGSAGSEAAAAHVGALASQFGASVDVLHVIDTREGGLGLSGAFLDDDPQAMSGRSPDEGYIGRHGDGPDPEAVEAGLTDHAEALIQASTGEVDLTTAVESGTPHSVILRYADEADADLVVMGTHGRTGVERYLLGSVAEKVVRLSDVPVMTVRADEDA